MHYVMHADTATVTILPGSVVRVCQARDPLEFTCTTNGTFIMWSFTARNSLGRLTEYGPTFINAEDKSQQTSVIRVNSSTFTFMRTSAQASSPLVSTLVINSSSVNRDLNGTVVNCTDTGTSMTASTTIHYVDKSTSQYNNIIISPVACTNVHGQYYGHGVCIIHT